MIDLEHVSTFSELINFLSEVGVELSEEQKGKLQNYIEATERVDELEGRDKWYARLHLESDEELFDRRDRGLCMKCDYGGPCTCYMAGEVLAYRGYSEEELDDEYDPVPPPVDINELV